MEIESLEAWYCEQVLTANSVLSSSSDIFSTENLVRN